MKVSPASFFVTAKLTHIDDDQEQEEEEEEEKEEGEEEEQDQDPAFTWPWPLTMAAVEGLAEREQTAPSHLPLAVKPEEGEKGL